MVTTGKNMASQALQHHQTTEVNNNQNSENVRVLKHQMRTAQFP